LTTTGTIDETTVPHSESGLAKITTALRRHGVTRVGIERGDGPVIEHLIRDGFEVVVISARQVKSLRARHGSAGNKDDRLQEGGTHVPTLPAGGHDGSAGVLIAGG
jgi:transposase